MPEAKPKTDNSHIYGLVSAIVGWFFFAVALYFLYEFGRTGGGQGGFVVLLPCMPTAIGWFFGITYGFAELKNPDLKRRRVGIASLVISLLGLIAIPILLFSGV